MSKPKEKQTTDVVAVVSSEVASPPYTYQSGATGTYRVSYQEDPAEPKKAAGETPTTLQNLKLSI